MALSKNIFLKGIVDDQDMVRRMAATMLERLGYEVLSARDGAEAVDIFRENQGAVQLVLTDLSMPRMNGWETLAAVRRILIIDHLSLIIDHLSFRDVS